MTNEGFMPAMTNETHCLSPVMPGLVPGIHVLTALQHQRRGWPSPAMTNEGFMPAMTNETHCLSPVMPGLVPGIHVLTALQHQRRGWPGQARP
jgi:hypothetical protein